MPQISLPLWCKRLGWLVAIWMASVIVMGIFAYLLRFFMTAVGMSG